MKPTRLATAVAALLLVGCAPSQPSVPQVTVGGEPDSQRSLAPDQVLEARKAAGIDACPTSNLAAKQRDGGLPALTLDCLGGDSKVNLAGLPTGRPYVINLWAQWCQPCADEAPYLADVARQTGGKVTFLGIDYGDPFPGKAIDFAIKHQTLYPQLVDPKQRSRIPLKVPGPPQTYFVDASGKLVHHETKVYMSAEELRAAIKEHLGVQA
ncbi:MULTISPECIES: TlpA family protein disulfide reductase [unclassified Luteococcus]|uniref:TlpA family protein disulfide reductase n=1 Tax=unclassified Luteococcus TaxID=2639923 RepID=UPI00313C9509